MTVNNLLYSIYDNNDLLIASRRQPWYAHINNPINLTKTIKLKLKNKLTYEDCLNKYDDFR